MLLPLFRIDGTRIAIQLYLILSRNIIALIYYGNYNNYCENYKQTTVLPVYGVILWYLVFIYTINEFPVIAVFFINLCFLHHNKLSI